MGKRAAAGEGGDCQPPRISQRLCRRKETPGGDAAPGLGSCSGTIQATQILKKLPGKRKKPDEQIQGEKELPGKRKKPDEQIQGEPLKEREGKRKKPDNAGGLRSCTTAATSQVPRLPTRSLSWGAKRARNAPAVSKWRDWANLDEGPAGLIAERVLANDVAGYVRFRAVCPAWRRCCADPRARGGVLDDPRFYPRQWIMLCGAYENLDAAAAPHQSCRQFLNTSTGQCIQVDIPELRDHGVLRATTAEGLLLLLPVPSKTNKADIVVRLLNPLTRQVAELPGITHEHDLRLCSSAGLVDDRTVCLYFPQGRTLAIAKPGDDRWVLLNTGPELLSPTIYFAGRFYGATAGAVMTVDMEAAGGPQLVVAAKMAKRVRVMVDSVHLADNSGDLTLVHCMVRRIRDPGDRRNLLDKKMYMVYRVDLNAGKMRLTSNLGGRAIFMNTCCALSVSPQVFPFLSSDTIYMGHSLFGNGQRGSYHLRDGSTEPCYSVLQKGEFTRPWSIADCLASYMVSSLSFAMPTCSRPTLSTSSRRLDLVGTKWMECFQLEPVRSLLGMPCRCVQERWPATVQEFVLSRRFCNWLGAGCTDEQLRQVLSVVAEFTEEEVKQAIDSIGDLKAPGPDGLP